MNDEQTGDVGERERERVEAHAFLTGKFETGWCMCHPDAEPTTELGKRAKAVVCRARQTEALCRKLASVEGNLLECLARMIEIRTEAIALVNGMPEVL